MHLFKKHRSLWNNILKLALVLLLIALVFILRESQKTVPAAISKGSRLLENIESSEGGVDQAKARELVLADESVQSLLSGKDFGFLGANPLTSMESRHWSNDGCTDSGADGACARVSFYNYSEGGTINAVVNLDTGQVLRSSTNRAARPGASPQILPRALAIAAADPRVAEVLGNVRQAEPVMGPMSAWLLDDDCRRDWCVDLTFAAPDGSGRTFHVFVNMEQEKVARLFYSRARPVQVADQPAERDRTWDDGCHEAYGWNVCWEMTAHDGIEFRDATYNGDSIFSNVKIAQVEVYYPSWPGGYRDEIGYAASVQPADGTVVTDLGDGFEVRQLFTEFMSWPNCVCCYRYEQILRFYEDGALDLHFISHGPGCDDPMIYRTFWRIDLDLDGPENEELLVWEDGQWVEVETEMSIPVFESLSPEGEVLITGAGDYRYRWLPRPTDPLGDDQGKIYLLRWNEDEGEGEIPAGPPDSFWPPGQWLTDESLTDENIVVWYIQILNGKKGDPWWCAPEPAPAFSPCDAEMRVEPIIEVTPTMTPTAEPTSTGEALTAPAASATSTQTREPTATPTTTPTTDLTPAATATPRPVEGDTAEEIARVSGCDNCHLIGDIGEAGKVGPDLSNIGILAAERVPGQSASEYLYASIVDPDAFLTADCPNGPCLAGIMPRDYGNRLRAEQTDLLVDYLLEQKAGSVQVTESGADQAPTPWMSPAVIALTIALGVVLILIVVFGILRWRSKRGNS
jgi:hypothetical protein